MKKLINFTIMSLFTINLQAEGPAHFKKDKLKEINKKFINSSKFLEDKNRERMEERETKISLFQEKAKSFEGKKDLSNDERQELSFMHESIQNFVVNQEEEMRKEYIIFEEELDSDIKKALAKFSKGLVLESTNIAYGGKDITKELAASLEGKIPSQLNNISNLKVFSVNFERILDGYSGAKDIKKYANDKNEELKNKQKELISKKDSKDFNIEEAQNILENMRKDIQETVQLMQERLLKNLENEVEKVALKENIDLVLNSKVAYTDVQDLTDKIIKSLESKSEEIPKKNTENKKVGFISYESVIGKYNKNEDKIKDFNKKNIEAEKILEEKANNIQKSKDNNDKDLEKLIQDFEKTKQMKFNELLKIRKDLIDNMNSDLRNAAKIVGQKNKMSLIFIKYKGKPEAIYSGKDLTKDVIDILANK